MSILDQWRLPGSGLEKYTGVYKTKHGMFAGVPIVCRGKDCPYLEVCIVEECDRVDGYRCMMEASAVLDRFEVWCKHFDIDINTDELKKEDVVDISLIRDLVDNEIQMLRAENKVAINSDFVGQTIVEIDKKCKVYREDTILPEAQYKLQLQDKRYKILNLLNSTRKDKVKEQGQKDPSTKALGILNKVEELLKKEGEN